MKQFFSVCLILFTDFTDSNSYAPYSQDISSKKMIECIIKSSDDNYLDWLEQYHFKDNESYEAMMFSRITVDGIRNTPARDG